jgi:hypothetical protein
MGKLHDRLAEQAPALRDKIRSVVAEHGGAVVSEVTVSQVFGGMRGG